MLVGPDTCDDAGVYRIGDDCALVETVDIITPLVDDPFTFGRIAATNALSDIYAMGARPLTAMNLVFFPLCTLPPETLAEILNGGQAALSEAGVCLVGGHTVEDQELKYGVSVTGIVSPDKIIRNSTARVGDLLLLTKPLGTGIISTAIKGEMAPQTSVDQAIRWMTTSNRQAAELMAECQAHAATDVTGFGLIGHGIEMARGAGVSFRFDLKQIPLMPGVADLISDGMVPAGCYRNRDHYGAQVKFPGQQHDRLLPLFDPQTSGGLLIALAPDQAERFMAQAAKQGIFCTPIGAVVAPSDHAVEILV